jgi:hypothetical protein
LGLGIYLGASALLIVLLRGGWALFNRFNRSRK